MKKWIIALALTSTGMVMAQENDGGQRACKRIEKMSSFVKDSLNLNSEQKLRVESLKSNACSKSQTAWKEANGDKEKFNNAQKEIMNNSRAELKTILNAEQQQKLKAHYEANNKHGKKDSGKHGKKEMNPEKRADKMTEKMKTSLGLSADQTTRVRAANLEFVNRMKVLHDRKKAGENKEDLKKTGKLVRSEYDAKIKSILTAEQYAKWEQMKKEKKEKHAEKKEKHAEKKEKNKGQGKQNKKMK